MSKIRRDLRQMFSQGPRIDLSKDFSKASGVALLFCGQDSEMEILFIKRAINTKDSWSGHLAFPGGKKEDSDATLLKACLREVHEEIGLQLSEEALVGSLDDIQARKRGNLMEFYIQPFVFHLDQKPTLTPRPEEVAGVEWVPLSYLRDQNNNTEYFYETEGTRLNLPGIRFTNGEILWGLTYMMVLNLFEKSGRS